MTKKEFMNLYGDRLIKGMKKDIESYFGKQLPFTVISTDLFDNKILVRMVKLNFDDVVYSIVTNYDKTDNEIMTNIMNDDCSITYKVYLNNSIFEENVITEDKDTEGLYPEFDAWFNSKVKDEKNYNYFVKSFNETIPEYIDCINENKKYNFPCLGDINTLIEEINESLYNEDYRTCNQILTAMICDMKIFKDAKDGKIKLPKIKKGKKK